MSKTFNDILNEHKTKETSKLSEAQKKYRDFELNNIVEEVLRRNRNASADYIKEAAIKLFAEADKRGESN